MNTALTAHQVNVATAMAFFESRKSLLQTYFPFILKSFEPSLSLGLDRLQEVIRQEVNVSIPISSLKSILNNNSRSFEIDKQSRGNWRIKLSPDGESELVRLRAQERNTESNLEYFYDKFISFCLEMGLTLNRKDAELIILQFTRSNLGSAKSSQLYLDLDTELGEKTTEKTVVRFLHQNRTDSSITKIYDDIWKGTIVWNEITKNNINDNRLTEGKLLSIYLDSNYIFSLLGYHHPVINIAAQELFGLMRIDSNLQLKVLDVTLEEMYRVLRAYEPNPTLRLFDYPTSSVYDSLLKKRTSKSSVERIIAKLEKDLLDMKIFRENVLDDDSFVDTVKSSDIYNEILYNRIENNDSEDVRIKKSAVAIENAAFHDAAVLLAILQVKDKRAQTFDNVKALFLTSSSRLPNAYKSLQSKPREGYPSIIQDIQLTNLLYLKHPDYEAKIAIDQVVKAHANYVLIDHRVWECYADAVMELENDPDVSEIDRARLIARSEIVEDFLLSSTADKINLAEVKRLSKLLKEVAETNDGKFKSLTEENEKLQQDLTKAKEDADAREKHIKLLQIYNNQLGEYLIDQKRYVQKEKRKYLKKISALLLIASIVGVVSGPLSQSTSPDQLFILLSAINFWWAFFKSLILFFVSIFGLSLVEYLKKPSWPFVLLFIFDRKKLNATYEEEFQKHYPKPLPPSLE